MTEKQLETHFKNWLTSHGIYKLGTPQNDMDKKSIGYWVKRWGGGQFMQAGLPDMQIVINGDCIEVELKAENGRLSQLQEQKLNQINLSGGMGIVLSPRNYEDFKGWVIKTYELY